MPNSLRFLTFILTLALLVVGGHVYLYRRLARDASPSPRVRRFAKVALTLLGGSGVVARVAAFLVPGVGQALSTLAWVWLGVSVYLILALAVWDLGRLLATGGARLAKAEAPQPERRLFLARAAGASAAVAAGGFSGFGIYRAYQPAQVTQLPIKLPGLPRALDGFSLVQLSDVHVGHAVDAAWMDDLVERCDALKPDALVITGDLVDAPVHRIGPIIAALSRVRTRSGLYFVTGNHDYYAGADEWCEAIGKMGITVLRNQRVALGDAGASFDLVGVDDWSARAWGHSTGYDLTRALAGRDPARGAVLLAHQPANFDLVAQSGVGLQLSGHTHGGQLFPLTALVGLRWPRSAGLYAQGDSRLYVSRGVGFVGPPMRGGSPPEIVKVSLIA